MKAPAIAIDLGTSYFRIAVFQNNKLEIIPNDKRQKATPSYISFTSSNELIGEEALNGINNNLKILYMTSKN